MTDHQELIELASLLPLGTLSPEEEQRVEEHLRGGCAECEQALRASAEVVDELAATVPPLEPSPGLRARLLAEAAAGGTVRPLPAGRRRFARIAYPLALAASVLAAIGLGLEARDLRRALESARTTIASLEERLGGESEERQRLARQLAAAETTLADLTARATRTVALAGTGPAPEASARAYLDPESQRLVLVVYQLPPPPPGRSYQLWVISGGEPVSAGVFDVKPGGDTRYATTAAPPLEGPVTIAVTLEPEGGVPKPSGPMVLAGS
jgi:anti-sigma-K factor RskA